MTSCVRQMMRRRRRHHSAIPCPPVPEEFASGINVSSHPPADVRRNLARSLAHGRDGIRAAHPGT
jgi:hypothetical protein